MNRRRLLSCATPALFLLFPGCHLCESRDVRHDTVLSIPPDQTCPSLSTERERTPSLDHGPETVDVWVARCCYDVIVDGGGARRVAERCEEHEVHSNWAASYLDCASREYRAARSSLLATDAGADAALEKIAEVTAGPRETRTSKERQCVYSGVVGHTSTDACG